MSTLKRPDTDNLTKSTNRYNTNKDKHTQKKPILGERTDRAWFRDF